MCVIVARPTEPTLYFDQDRYVVDESDGHVLVKVWRQGTDLSNTSEVTVRSKKTNPSSAECEYIHICMLMMLVECYSTCQVGIMY